MISSPRFSYSGHHLDPGFALPTHQDDRSANFVSGKLTLVSTDNKGLDVIANQSVRTGETLVIYGGGFVDRDHLDLIPTAMRPFFFQVADGIWFGHGFDEQGIGIAERINHSCNPSAGFHGIAEVVSLRDIRQGESITIDYSSIQSEDLEGSSFQCACGSGNCRRLVSVDDWRKVAASSPLLRHMQPFLQSHITPKASSEATSFSELKFPSKWQSPHVDGMLQSTLISGSIELAHDGTAWATTGIPKGEVVFIASGKVLHKSIEILPDESVRPHLRPLNRDLYLGPRHSSDVAPTQVAQVHDSRSNVELRLEHMFVATRDIKAGEEIILHSGRSHLIPLHGAYNSDIIPPALDSRPHLPSAYPFLPIAPNTDTKRLSEERPHPSLNVGRLSHSGAPSDSTPYSINRVHEGNSPPETQVSRGHAVARMAQRAMRSLSSFIKGAVLEDWMAAPIAFVGSMTATFATALCVAGIAPALERLFGSTYSPAYIAATSATAVVLGYASYCLFYWGGMLIKERGDLLDESGKFSKDLLKKKWEIFKWDFLLHLPSDAYWAVGMFGVQSGLYATGATDLFWSIIAAQGLSDVYYSLREPFYWRAAKKSAEWRMRRAQTAHEAANRDNLEPTVEKKVGNA